MTGLIQRLAEWVRDRLDGIQTYLLVGMSPVEAQDARTVMRAVAAGVRRFPAHRAALEAVLSRTPDPYPEIDISGPELVARGFTPTAALFLIDKAERLYPDRVAPAANPTLRYNTYGGAAYWLGVGYLNSGEPEAAVEVLKAALRRQPGLSTAVSELGVSLEAAGRRDEALALYEDWLGRREEINGGALQEILISYGHALIQTGRLDEAERAFLDLRAVAPDHPLIAVELEQIAAQRCGAPPVERVLRMT